MDRRRARNVLWVVLLATLTVVTLVSVFPSLAGFVIQEPTADDYKRATVVIREADTCRTLGTVDVRIADSFQEKYTGLSDTPSLENGTGMLFVYEEEDERTFVMRGMDYPLDIVFIGADGRINDVTSAPAPGPDEDGNQIQRSGSAKWILEVPRGWMAAHGVTEGDRVIVERRDE